MNKELRIKKKSHNSYFIIRDSNLGFTLIELLAVMVVLVSIGTIVGTILFSALRGNTKTNSISIVRQNGVYAIQQMTKMLRDARSFDGVSTDNITYSTICGATSASLTPTPTPTPIEYGYIKITSFDDKQTTFACSTSGISSNSASLIDTTAVSIVSCTISCFRPTLSNYPTIVVDLSLTQYAPTGVVQLEENKASINFQASVEMRNVNR